MSREIDGTHDSRLRSFVESAEGPTDFPIQNLPLGVFRQGDDGEARIGCAIGEQVLDLRAAKGLRLLEGLPSRVLSALDAPALNALMACPGHERRALRHRLSHLLRAEGGQVTARPHAKAVLLPQGDVQLLLPAAVGDYTDFYASVFHATNVGKMLRPDNPLVPNYKHVPIGYHGRASSLVPSGATVKRPSGQTEPASADGAPGFGPSRSLDYELEVGFFVAEGNPLGQPIPLAEAEQRLFGLVLINDWSARDLQKWEYNRTAPTWPEFYATRRVLPYLKLARDRGGISPTDANAVDRVVRRIVDLAGPDEPPARLHGDLWSGNLVWTSRAVWLVDPAAHGGHRETDLAMLALFGCPQLPRVLDAYQEATPLADGWEDRVALHQLFPLLVHACLFGRGSGGSGYGARAGEAARSLL